MIHFNHLNAISMRAALQARDSLKMHCQNFSAMEALNDKINQTRVQEVMAIVDYLKKKPMSEKLRLFRENSSKTQ